MATPKISRRRGARLTDAGHQKLQAAIAAIERVINCGRYTKEDLSRLTGLSLNTIAKIFGSTPSLRTPQKVPVDKKSLDLCFAAFNLVLERGDYLYPDDDLADMADSDNLVVAVDTTQGVPLDATPDIIDWGEAPDVSVFYGREQELAQLARWVQIDRCKLVAILGMGGIGKTTLVTKLAQQLQPQFPSIVWRSLRNAPLLTDLIPELIQTFSQQRETIPPTLDLASQISRLLHYLRTQRCLLVLDNAETIIYNQSSADSSQTADFGYQELLRRLGESVHQSCLLITSREKPQAVIPLAGDKLLVRTLTIPRLNPEDSENLFNAKSLSASAVGRSKLREIYSGNPLALNIVATSICDLFDGDIDRFLATQAIIFNGIEQLLDPQFERLTPREQVVMYWMAIEREWISPTDLQARIVPAITMPQLLATLEHLGRKSLIEGSKGKFTQQAMVMEYTTARFIDRVVAELTDWQPQPEQLHQLPLWLSHPLMRAQSPIHIRTAQTQLILAPIASQIQSQYFNRVGLDRYIQAVLVNLRTHYRDRPHYGGGNLINLLRYWQIDLTGYNFANLAVWQADLQGVILHDVNFSGADLARSQLPKLLAVGRSRSCHPNG